jgi:ElaB/YqjD/DUF883 family membrane-anchored ribosome-binding protein
MYKTPVKRKKTNGRSHTAHSRSKYSHKSDVDKIKAFLWKTTKNFRNETSDKLHRSQDYLSERPFQSVGVSLMTGLVVGGVLGYFINHHK